MLVEADALAIAQPGAGLPYLTTPSDHLATSAHVTATAVPYFQWDNRDGGAMRVWLPLA